MLSADGCRQRRQRLWQQLEPQPPEGELVLTDPLALIYLANCFVDPFSLGAGFGAILILRPDGYARLLHHDRMPDSVMQAHVDERQIVSWYDGHSPGHGPRQLAAAQQLDPQCHGFRNHDRPGDPYALILARILAALRRQKDADEIVLVRRCMRAGEVGHAWARANVTPGMTELDVYAGIAAACTKAAGQAVIIYGDFAVSPGSSRRGGPPTGQVIELGDMLILDFSVVIHGYRSDFTNTLVVGKEPTPEQHRLWELSMQAMATGERELRPGAECRTVYQAVNGVFEQAGMAQHFGHHVGHGLGLSHPEAPFFVKHANETLLIGDVVTLEPGLYVDGIGGLRIEHNYLITPTGCERLSHHVIALR